MRFDAEEVGRMARNIGALLDEVCGADTVRDLDALRVRCRLDEVDPEGLGAENVPASVYKPSVSTEYVNYLFQPPERFARAYAQYVTLRGGNPELKDRLDAIREPGFGVYYPQQWSDEDFEPIARAFDALFAAEGWLKEPPASLSLAPNSFGVREKGKTR